MRRYIVGKNDIHAVMGVKVYTDYCQEHGATRNWLQRRMPYTEISDIPDVKSWKSCIKNSRYYLDHSCLEHGENYVPICILDKSYPENIGVFTIVTNSKELVTFHPKDFFISCEYAIQLADDEFHEMFIGEPKDNFHIDYLEMPAYVMLWNTLSKYYPKLMNEIRIYLSHYKVESIVADKPYEESRMHISDVMRFYNKPKYKTQER